MKIYKSKIGWILSAPYILLFIAILVVVSTRYKGRSHDSFSGVYVLAPNKEDVALMQVVIYPWGRGIDNWSEISAQEAVRHFTQGVASSKGVLIPPSITNIYYSFLAINTIIFYFIGFFIETLMNRKKYLQSKPQNPTSQI